MSNLPPKLKKKKKLNVEIEVMKIKCLSEDFIKKIKGTAFILEEFLDQKSLLLLIFPSL